MGRRPDGHAMDMREAAPRISARPGDFSAEAGGGSRAVASTSTTARGARTIPACTREGARSLRNGSRRSPGATDLRSSGSTTATRRLVYSLALRILGIRADAEDVVQEVFLQVWKRAETYRPDRGSPECWILTIARNRALAKIRAANTMKKGLGIDALPIRRRRTSSRSSGPIVRAESALAVRSALARLPDEQRRVLELAYFDGLTQSEIAARLGEPLGTVKTRIRLGMERLRRLVGGGEMPEGLP